LPFEAGGFYTEEIRERGQRKGFALVTLSGRRGILAHVDFSSRYRVGKYKVNLEDLERIGVRELEESLRRKGLIVVDEIGKMELFSLRFQEIVLRILDSHKPVLATIMKKSHPYADAIKARPDVQVFEVAPSNRDELVEEIANILLF